MDGPSFEPSRRDEDPERHEFERSGRLTIISLYKGLPESTQKLFDLLLESVDQVTRSLITGPTATLEAFTSIAIDPSQSKTASLYAGYLLSKLKSIDNTVNPQDIDEELFAWFVQEDDLHKKHCIALALQGSCPSVAKDLLQLLRTKDHGDFASVALRMTHDGNVLEELVHLARQDDFLELRNRAISALAGSDGVRVDYVLGDSPLEYVQPIKLLLKSAEATVDLDLKAQKQLLLQTMPYAKDVFLSEDQVNPVAIVNEEQGEVLFARQAYSGRLEDAPIQIALQLSKDSKPYSAEISSTVNGLALSQIGMNVLTKVAEYRLLAARRKEAAESGEQALEKIDWEVAKTEVEDRGILVDCLRYTTPVGAAARSRHFKEHLPFLRLIEETGTVHGAKYKEGTLRYGDLVYCITDKKHSRKVQLAAAFLLQDGRQRGPLGTDVDDIMIQVIAGLHDDFTKHAAAIALQGTRHSRTQEQLRDLFFSDATGDFAAVALRGSYHQIAQRTLVEGILHPNQAVVERAALASLQSYDRDLRKVITSNGALRKDLQEGKYSRIIARIAAFSPVASLLLPYEMGRKLLSYALDTRAAQAVTVAGQSFEWPTTSSSAFSLTLKNLPIKESLYRNLKEDAAFVGFIGNTTMPLYAREAIDRSTGEAKIFLGTAPSTAMAQIVDTPNKNIALQVCGKLQEFIEKIEP
ncbi:MAG: hypothetical protein KDD70_01975 [Bdellovibrionales bacterium]|nr:hypothetical protein [Bdellovibrionales bacterium]